ncbi:G2/mitotic-specific cyclin-A-like [Oopsacas minuta]|uniref:G2/mitotic-specific cyclin-A-like n=1 Tax=Oopsacas minuta TaxID=111878 RepID=A0AAV7JJQ9_9METZ|nr:G2/mitotic-specific cyclin-A-like [Oopsacas minuta]
MDFALKRTNKFENLSTRGRQVKREGENIGLPTSESKRTKRNPLTSFQNILSNRPTIRLKKTVVQAAADKAKVSSDERNKSSLQDKTAPFKKKGDRISDQENVDPVSRLPIPRERRTIFGNPFTKKKSAQVIPYVPKQEPAPLGGAKQHLVKVRVPANKGDENKPRVVVTQSKGAHTTSATSHPVTQGPHPDVSRRVALTKSGTLSSALHRVSATNTMKGGSQIHLTAPEMKRKPLGVISQTGTNSDSNSSSVTSQIAVTQGGVSSGVVMNQSLNSSFLQTFSKMNTIDQRANPKISKENPPSGPYLRLSNRPVLQTTRISDPATSHLILLPQTTELSCTPVKNDIIMQSPAAQLTDPLLDLDCISTQYLLCPEYAQGAFIYLKGIQSRYMPAVAYLSKQQDINEGMRAILVDWLVEVSTEYKLKTQTLFLAINYIDRFLSLMSVSRTKLQLVGTCCMYVASKFEEIYPPELSEFAFITDDTYTKRQVVRMEALILKALEFNLLAPTAHLFAERFIRAVTPSPDNFKHLVAYLCELALLNDKIILRYNPSMVAASAVSLSAETVGLPGWSSSLTRHTGYHWFEIQTCRTLLHLQFHSAPNFSQQAIQTKYRSADYLGVSALSLSLPKHSS